jgi:hypothetical protein
VAAYLAALLPPPEKNVAIIQAFRANIFTGPLVLPGNKIKLIYLDDDRDHSSPLKTKVIAYDSLPKVKQFGKIMWSVYKDFCVTEFRSKLLVHLQNGGGSYWLV